MIELMKALHALLEFIPTMILWYVGFAVLERFFPAVEHKPIKGWIFNISVSVLYVAVGALAGCVAALIGGKLKPLLHGGLIDLKIGNRNSIVGDLEATLLSILIFDFFYYWWHRSEHKCSALWAIHKLHHMDRGINVSTDNRHHWLEDVGRIPTITIPMAVLFDLSPAAGGVIGFVFSAWTFFIHANLKLSLGRFSWLFDGPQVHRIHHSRLPEHFDRNFAAFFPIWDVIFGTYFHPRPGEFPPTGVADEAEVTTLRDAALLPFRTWRQTLRARSAAIEPVDQSPTVRTAEVAPESHTVSSSTTRLYEHY
jgi:sterol desaturase/sphingolipid hydroxylase (fatty acid hydroxylase superfamily)